MKTTFKFLLFLGLVHTLDHTSSFAASSRIKDIGTTATAPATDDYFPIDGTTNGTRKILGSRIFVDPAITHPDAAMGALAIDVTKRRNTKTATGNHTFTFSGTPAAGTVFGMVLTGHTSATTQTIPSSKSLIRNGAALTTFVLPADSIVELTWVYDGTNYHLAGEPFNVGDLTSVTVATGDKVALHDVSAGTDGQATVASILALTVQADVTGVKTSDSPEFASVNVGHATDTTITRTGAGDIAVEGNAIFRVGGSFVGLPGHEIVAISDETTAITTGTAKVTWRAPFALTITAVRASLATASSSGTPTFDINEGGTTILSTKLTIDASEKTSTTAATAAVISDTAIADDAEITIDVDTAGTGAAGAKITIYYVRA